MNCYRCGSVLNPGDKFCSKCGAPLPEGFEIVEAEVTAVDAEQAPADAPESAAVIPAAPAEEGAAQPAAEDAAPAVEAAAPEETKPEAPRQFSAYAAAPAPAQEAEAAPKKKKAGKWLFTLFIVILACLVLAGALFYFLVLNRQPAKAFAYMTQDGQLYALSSLKEGDKGYQLSDDGSSENAWCEFSKDGRFVYYMIPGSSDDISDMQLYRAEMSMLSSKGYEAEKISGGVYGYGGIYPVGDGALYIRSDGKTLRYFDGTGNTMLAKGVDYIQVSEDGSTVFYESYDEDDGSSSVYRVNIADGSSEKLIEGAYIVYSELTAPNIVYTVIPEEDDSWLEDIYVLAQGEKEGKLIASGTSGVREITENSANGLVFYYCTTDSQEKTLLDFVSDDLKLADADPQIPAEYDITSYELYEIYNENGQWTYEDYYSEEHHPFIVTDEELTNAGVDPEEFAAVEEPSYGFMYDLINDVLVQRFYKNQEKIDAAYDEYYAAADRNYWREYLADIPYYMTEADLHEYRNGSDSVLASGIDGDSLRSDLDCTVFLYEKVPADMGGVIDIRDIESEDDVYEALWETYYKEISCYSLIDGSEREFDNTDIPYIDGVYSLDSGEYFVLSNAGNNGGIIREYKAADGGLEFVKIIADDVYHDPMVSGAGGSEKLYFMSSYSEESISADLYSYARGSSEIIGRGLSHAVFFENGEVYYFTDCVENDEFETSGTLNKAVAGEPLKIDTEVETWNLYNDGAGNLVYITSDGDLMLWNGKDAVRIARFVERFWMYGELPFDWLMCY